MIFVYQNECSKKSDLLGRVPIQVKGTATRIVSDIATYACSVEDLRNYYNDGGIIFFLISVDTSTNEYRIFYASLLVYDLKRILDKAGANRTYTIHLKRFPEDDKDEVASIFLSFVDNSKRQMSFIGKELYSLEELAERGVEVESLTFNVSGRGLDLEQVGSFISLHDFYLYAKPKGLDIDIPVDKVSDAVVSRPVYGKVSVREREYYSSYDIFYEKGKPSIHIGKCVTLVLPPPGVRERASLSIKATGTLSEYALALSLFVDVAESEEISLNGNQLPFQRSEEFDIAPFKSRLAYCNDVLAMLTLLGVSEELQIDALSEKDSINIKNFVNALLYNRPIGFQNADSDTIQGAIKIANLDIWIWASKRTDGYYKLESFFSPHPVVFFSSEDIDHTNPIPASHYLLLTKEAFCHTSNMDCELIAEDINSMTGDPQLSAWVTLFLLDVLRGYDLQSEKDTRLLILADRICEWLSRFENDTDAQVLTINRLQITKRRRNLNSSELGELSKLIANDVSPEVKCGAYLLLGDTDGAQVCFNLLTPQQQDDFLTYPICYFGTSLVHSS